MKLYSHNAEALLRDKAKSLQVHHNSWRCLHLDFANHKDSFTEGLRTHVVITIIHELLENVEGYIYLCDDGDVFILFQGQAAEILDKLGEHIKSLGNPKGKVRDALYTVYDLSIHWGRFYEVVEKKASAGSCVKTVPVNAASVEQQPLRNPDAMLFKAALGTRSHRKRMLVLVVEDDVFTRRLIGSVLKDSFDVVTAGTGAEAIAAYEGSAPDAVFLDIELPDCNGHVILSKLIALDPSAFVVMLSANSVKENILAALEKGAQGFVTKPFAKEKLLHYLRVRAGVQHA